MPQNPLEWAGAIIGGFIGCIVGFSLFSLLGLLALFGLPLLFILLLQEGLDGLLGRNKTKVINTKAQNKTPPWVWQPFIAGIIAGTAWRLIEGAVS